MKSWRIRMGEELLARNGERVAGPGELVAADHPAALAHFDMSRIANAEDAGSIDAEMTAAAHPEPGEEGWVEPFMRPWRFNEPPLVSDFGEPLED